MRLALLNALHQGIEQMFELTTADLIVMGLAVILAVIALILLIRWVD